MANLLQFWTSVVTAFTQRRSIAKNVGCFQQRLFVCSFVCQHDNCRASKHRMMKLGGRCIVHKFRSSWNLGVIAPWVRTPTDVAFGYDVAKISAGCLVVFQVFTLFLALSIFFSLTATSNDWIYICSWVNLTISNTVTVSALRQYIINLKSPFWTFTSQFGLCVSWSCILGKPLAYTLAQWPHLLVCL